MTRIKAMLNHWNKNVIVLLGVLLLFCCIPMSVQASDTPSMDDLIEQIGQLQQLAESYVQQGKTNSQPLELTINYIRAKRYNDVTWDMVLGSANSDFSTYVSEQSPALKQLQNQQNVLIPQTGETVDFVHLVAGIGAAYRGLAVVCTWGGDCIQLAESIQGTQGSEQDCIQKLAPYFATEQESSSLFPKSDWIADLDGINIGSQLSKESDLAHQMEAYYSKITAKDRVRQFVQNQFGTVDTSNTASLRSLVKETFFQDSGIQLFLMSKEYITLDENKNTVIVAAMQQPLNAVCCLLADTISQQLEGEVVTADNKSTETPQQTLPATQSTSDASLPEEIPQEFVEVVQGNPQFLLYVAGASAIGIVLVLLLMRKRHE